MTRLLFCALAALGLACAGYDPSMIEGARYQCTNDQECGEGEVCFPDGCGDPGQGIVVEVVPGTSSGQLAQEFPVEELKAIQDINAREPSVVQGTIQQESEKGGVLPWPNEVSVVALGESTLIPGRSRQVQYTVLPENGAYEVPIPSGSYTLVFSTRDSLYPPVLVAEQFVTPGASISVDVTYPLLTSLVQVEGYLVKTAATGAAVDSAEMQVQAFDPVSGKQLSQRADASSGVPSVSTGYFRLWVAPGEETDTIRIVASPKLPNELVPTKTFDVPLSQHVGDLELGDFGSPVTVTGKVVSTNDQPLANAQVRIDGTVTGGGKFRSAPGVTDDEGRFTIQTLPSGKGFLELVVTPSPKADAGQLRKSINVPSTGGDLKGPFVAPDKVQVMGSLTRPDGTLAEGVQVRAQPILKEGDFPLPIGGTVATTDGTGSFTLRLDPAVYRLDFIPADNLPRVSRFVTVTRMPGSTGAGFAPISMPPFTLSRGRTVTGTVRSIPARFAPQDSPVPAPGASVSFFRVVQFGEVHSHILLAEGLADADGRYQVILPTR